MLFLLYKSTENGVFEDFPKISDHFPKISEVFPKLSPIKYANPRLKFNLRLGCVAQSPINANLTLIGGLNLIHLQRKIKSLIGRLILK